MAVQPQQTSWTDERLDDLNQSIRDGFARNDREHQEFRQEMREMRTELNDQFRTLHRVMIAGLFTLCAAIIAAGFLPS
jgi:hypothetical protein